MYFKCILMLYVTFRVLSVFKLIVFKFSEQPLGTVTQWSHQGWNGQEVWADLPGAAWTNCLKFWGFVNRFAKAFHFAKLTHHFLMFFCMWTYLDVSEAEARAGSKSTKHDRQSATDWRCKGIGKDGISLWQWFFFQDTAVIDVFAYLFAYACMILQGWVLLSNCHLMQHWPQQVERFLTQFQGLRRSSTI